MLRDFGCLNENGGRGPVNRGQDEGNKDGNGKDQ
jgi:hypothetical protein